MKYLLLTPKGEIEESEGPMDVIDAQRLLDDDFEVLQPSVPPPFVVLVGENGKQHGLIPNWGVSRLLSSVLRPGDYVVGPAIITGPPNAAGDLTDMTDEVLAVIRKRIER